MTLISGAQIIPAASSSDVVIIGDIDPLGEIAPVGSIPPTPIWTVTSQGLRRVSAGKPISCGVITGEGSV
jgi:hypothetical protein